jgi:phosphatidylglycerol:prolipoprotein diacylglycerol transferase
MLPILHLGPLAIQTAGLVVILSLWLGLTLSERLAVRIQVTRAEMDNLALVVLVAGLLGARLTYIARYPDAFLHNPFSLISPSPALLDVMGGIAVAAIAAAVYMQRRKMSFWRTMDALTPAFAVLFVGIGVSHLASGAAFGAPSNLPWSIDLWGSRRHPSQIYEILAASGILVFVWQRFERFKYGYAKLTVGSTFLTFLALSAGSRLFLEAFRGDSILLFGHLRSAQLVSWLILAFSLFMLERFHEINLAEHPSTIENQADGPIHQPTETGR